ncbi:MAG: thiamine biosynthesis protein ThiS [Omnitrophica WOR_2 bacterium GWF2_38_59]|nr:MAG: thiamine biosynthesis protein ThiS [Omnitrophica WOR_2 bacterium GWA2_37_7]OGX22114.1 MAG: thiamine biosynthesis protein ThiS [Omnitrophica WOR_2 bacterium GWF2_38_59]OGX46769.1 MAG: thiamine biosynthesis protein ThiS [Omnitrophica WOR_2 bacterium RIFOXYA2_FULL_38_17]OGX53452.1 MAG: thiamine biosynthesis protein ThiS [Omnitrophica WOR_2 bacterium RIFOXYA12_FULL_38_10]OGX56620.1 MAG: thiamine biosynthesis protein ThiS [Omnitrophica WOR_2 bacterium RIFOXYC2_FULL_38_12]OGX59863.1 MAG: thi
MKITVNGQEKVFESSLSLENLIENLSQNKDHVIAELNGNIIKSSKWLSTAISDGDAIELVTFVGGG